MKKATIDILALDQTPTLGALFRERVRRSSGAVACIQFEAARGRWETSSWAELAREVARWQSALRREDLSPGDRVAVMLRNCRQWMVFDQAALGLGLVTVPIYTNDRAENIGFILQDAGVRLLLIETEGQWRDLERIQDQLAGLKRIVTLQRFRPAGLQDRVSCVEAWLAGTAGELQTWEADPNALATIMYTSGTTGRSKGVMLSHRNILWNAQAALAMIPIYPQDRFLSFLPLSHTLERTVGYYLPLMAGASIAYARSIPQLADDLLEIRPTVLISVPRIFERVYAKIQAKLAADPAIARHLFRLAVEVGWKRFLYRQKRGGWSPGLLLWPLLERLVAAKIQAKLGGRLRVAVSGGAPLSPDIGRVFLGLGVPIVQGYGLTETSPIVSGNPVEDNVPASIGIALPGVEVKIAEHNELLTRSPSVMLGYWNSPEATRQAVDPDGWLHTGDQARREGDHLFITGRLKEIIVLANGEKVPPADMEMAIVLDDLFEQVMVIGEGKPYLTALVVLNRDRYRELAPQLGLDPDDPAALHGEKLEQALVQRIGDRLHSFPGFAQLYRVAVLEQPWSVENGLMTPTLKLRRSRILEAYRAEAQALYAGH
jgi:long-chain acyl-CoA synthetase